MIFNGAQSPFKSKPHRKLHQTISNVGYIFDREHTINASRGIYLIGLKSTYAADLGAA